MLSDTTFEAQICNSLKDRVDICFAVSCLFGFLTFVLLIDRMQKKAADQLRYEAPSQKNSDPL